MQIIIIILHQSYIMYNVVCTVKCQINQKKKI